MISQRRPSILERLLSDGSQQDSVTASSHEERNNQSEFSYQTRGEIVPYFVDLSKNNLIQVLDFATSSSIGENLVCHLNPTEVLTCAEDVSSLPTEANVACMPNFRVQQPSPFTMVPHQVINDVHNPIDVNLITEQEEPYNSLENPLTTTNQEFYNEASNRLRHFTVPFNHLPFHQNGAYPDFSLHMNNQLHHYPLPYSNQTDMCATYHSTDTIDCYHQPQMQVFGELCNGELCNENVPNFYEYNFAPQYFFNQSQVLESQANSHMYNEMQYANYFQESNYLSDHGSDQYHLSDMCENPFTSEAPYSPWTILNDTTPTNQEIVGNCTQTGTSSIDENNNETFAPNLFEKLRMADVAKPMCVVEEASLSEKIKAQVDKFMKSPKKQQNLKKWPCPECGRVLARASTLKIHLRQHSGDRPFRCPLCPKAFAQASSLDSHHRIHSKERPYSCTVCHKTFVHSSAFKTHTRTHTGERPHSCPVPNCGMAFSDISTLRKHARVHNGERPYLCDICNRRFTQSGNLKKHRRSVHKVTDPPKVQKKTQENVGKVLENNENTPRETLVISGNFPIL